jgi:hypothetical protein
MRIKNKYLRNRIIHNKFWNRIRQRHQPYKTIMPWFWDGSERYNADEQIKNHFDNIKREVRGLENGHNWVFFKNASSGYRRMINKERKAQERHALAKIRNGNYDIEFPRFRKDAAWLFW